MFGGAKGKFFVSVSGVCTFGQFDGSITDQRGDSIDADFCTFGDHPIEALSLGDPLERGTFLGPVTDQRAVDRFNEAVAEAAVVGATDPTTGQGIVAFVILRADAEDGEGLVEGLRKHVVHEIGPLAKPRQIMVVKELPKTRSGKIMRRLLKDVAEHRELGDVTTLADPTVMNLISEELSTTAEE